MNDIPGFDTFAKAELIHKGCSGDKKYYVETKEGKRLLLRVSDISLYEEKRREFDIVKRMSATGMKMSLPISFGVCENGKSVYQLLSWCDGTEAKAAMKDLSAARQYSFGRKAAKILRHMETIDSKPASFKWAECYRERVERYIGLYRKCGYTFDGDGAVISYLRTQWRCIGRRPTALMHEDFQTDNMVISPDGELYVIDFQTCGMTDPYLSMTGVGVSAISSVPFALGQMDEYFGETVPDDFWEMYHYYMLAEMLYAFTVGVKNDEDRADTLHMFDGAADAIKHSGPRVPFWYKMNNRCFEGEPVRT